MLGQPAPEGLNLHARCRVVVNLEVPWTPLRFEQRVGRVDRLGGEEDVRLIEQSLGLAAVLHARLATGAEAPATVPLMNSRKGLASSGCFSA